MRETPATMASTIAIAAVAALAYWIYWNVSSLTKNIAGAKRSGLPYAISPISPYNMVWLITHRLWLPILRVLPGSWTEAWLPFMTPDWTWELLYEPIKNAGDMFILVSPGRNYLHITNAEAASQITSRREAFPKPLESYRILEVFGRNIITTEGSDWKKHRKISAPVFNEKNNVLVFSESCTQAQGMLRKWLGSDGKGNTTLTEVPMDTMRVTLHIISRIGFGVSLLWPGEEPNEKLSDQTAIFNSSEPPQGHTMTFEDSLSMLLDHMVFILITPEWLLKRLPFKVAKKSYQSLVNWRQYMNELFSQKVAEARASEKGAGMDIMGTLVKSSYGKGDDVNPLGRRQRNDSVLSDSDILGNAFVMIVAGHETTANAIHFSLVQLAINPKSQRVAQKEVQNIFGDTEPETWDYELTINTLLGGILGAILNEQLRLMPPVISIPKSVTDDRDQELLVAGKKYILQGGTRIGLNTVGIARSPAYWPTQPSKVSDKNQDLDDFRPERWLLNADGKEQTEGVTESDNEDTDEFGGFTGKSSSAKLFHPVRGSYLPFSDGPRSCVGRRLAQVKIMAVLAVIFQKCSIELAVDAWATDEEVARMSQEEKRAIYRKAQDKANAIIRGCTSLITLKLHGEPSYIPVRIVMKGDERFVDFIERAE